MKPRALCEKLNEVLDQGLEREIFLAVQPHILSGPASLQALGPTTGIGMISDGGVTPAEFIQLLDENRYSAVFNNAAVIGVECTFINSNLRSHRYTFIPCPFEAELVALRPSTVPLADWLRESVLPYGTEVLRSVGCYRFDCVRVPAKRTSDPHPVSHFTFGSPDCRVPVRGPLSIKDFLNFIFDNFYRDIRPFWLEHAPFLVCDGVEPTITMDEQQMHHVYWEDQ